MINETAPSLRSILVIDDDWDDFEQVSEAIKQIAPQIEVYFLDKCDNIKKYLGQNFDLVLLDINMPRHDGFYWLRGIREHGFKDLPVIMYTNSTRPGHIAKAYEEGANLFFPKPDRFDHLLKGFRKLVHLNWTNPSSVTANYRKDGEYAIFTP